MSSSSIQKRFTIGYTDARGVAPERAGADQAIGGAPVAAEDAQDVIVNIMAALHAFCILLDLQPT